MECALDLDELVAARNKCQKGKACGPDGLRISATAFGVLGLYLIHVIIMHYRGIIAKSKQRKGHAIFVHPKG